MITAVETPNAIRWRQALLTDRDKTLEYLYTRTWPVVRQYVKQQQGTEEDAKDVLQDAMIIFFEKVVHDQLVLTAAPVTYLAAISKNRWRQEMEKRSRQLFSPDNPEPQPAEPDAASANLMHFVDQLGEKCRDILVQFYYFGQRLEKIAYRHGYGSIRSATVQKFKCLERLRKKVAHLSIGDFQ
jgi:RNA polymerase sigma factor (sigma-70 family)